MRRLLLLTIAVMLVAPACTSGSLQRVPSSPTPPATSVGASATPSPSPVPTGQASPTPTPTPTASILPQIQLPGGLSGTSAGAAFVLLLDRLVEAETRAARAEAETQSLREQIARLQALVDALQAEVRRLAGGRP